MSEIKKGDRVKVEYEGTVTGPSPVGEEILVRDGSSGGTRWVWVEHCTVIPKPYVPQVGDLVRCLEDNALREITYVLPDGRIQSSDALRFFVREVDLVVHPGKVYVPKGDS